MPIRKIIAGLLLLTGSAAAAAEGPSGVLFAGGSAGDGISGYAGVVSALNGHLGHGIAVRASANAGNYRYQAGNDPIEAHFYGGEVALVYQLSGEWGWANLSAGPRVTHTELSPDDRSNERRGTRFDVGLQSDGAYWLDRRWRFDWLGSLGVTDRSYYSRVAITRLVNEARGTRIGLEAGVQGDRRYTARRAGVFAATRIGPALEGQAAFGAVDQELRPTHAYGSVGFSLLF
jgi:hypothetical protein